MNILYVAPYKNNLTHHECFNHINTLEKDASVTSYPIYIDPNTVNSFDDLASIHSDNICQTNYDAVIQHAPLDYLIPFSKDVTKKNYCIPIMKYAKNTYDNHDKLLAFDAILVDSKYDANFLSSDLGLKTKRIKLFSYTNHHNNNQIVNLTHHTNNYKIYTFVNYQNIYFINHLLLSFFMIYQEVPGVSFIIASDSAQLTNQINNTLEDFIQKTNIQYIKHYIKILSIDNNISNVYAIHKSCDCYVDLRSHTNKYFHSFIAKHLGNACITNENLDADYEPVIARNMGSLDQTFKVSTIVSKMKNVIRTKPINKLDNIPTLDQIVCN